MCVCVRICLSVSSYDYLIRIRSSIIIQTEFIMTTLILNISIYIGCMKICSELIMRDESISLCASQAQDLH